jgi:hypothetical protein
LENIFLLWWNVKKKLNTAGVCACCKDVNNMWGNVWLSLVCLKFERTSMCISNHEKNNQLLYHFKIMTISCYCIFCKIHALCLAKRSLQRHTPSWIFSLNEEICYYLCIIGHVDEIIFFVEMLLKFIFEILDFEMAGEILDHDSCSGVRGDLLWL